VPRGNRHHRRVLGVPPQAVGHGSGRAGEPSCRSSHCVLLCHGVLSFHIHNTPILNSCAQVYFLGFLYPYASLRFHSCGTTFSPCAAAAALVLMLSNVLVPARKDGSAAANRDPPKRTSAPVPHSGLQAAMMPLPRLLKAIPPMPLVLPQVVEEAGGIVREWTGRPYFRVRPLCACLQQADPRRGALSSRETRKGENGARGIVEELARSVAEACCAVWAQICAPLHPP